MVNVKIYVATHMKYDKIKSDDLYAPILLGSYKSDEDFGYLRDDVGDNISTKNIQYSELTGLYWIWKHSNEDIIGLCHYRRYFSKNIFKSKQIIDKTDVLNALENHDIIAHKRTYPISNDVFLKAFGGETFFEKSKSIFSQIYPEYMETLENVYNDKKTYGYSCFITNKKIFGEYCKWLFDYLTVIENELEWDMIRVLGYYGEVLLTVYILYNNLNVTNFPLYYVESRNNFISNCIDYSLPLSWLFQNVGRKYIPKIISKLKK